jgi:endonuclease/exonuclease/phosphatase family metal-dependent hydrolase
MTRNLYLGANLDAIVQAKSTREAFLAVEKGWGDVRANDFPTRARAIAKEIASARPDFVGFQELSLYRTQTPADFTVTPSTTVALDYAKELRKALAARKLRYRFLAIGNATDAELPSGDPPNMDIRLTIRDGLLVRIDKKIKIRRVRTGLYSTTTPLRRLRHREARLGARRCNGGWPTFRVITTHLESFNDVSQVAQGKELVAPVARRARVCRRFCSGPELPRGRNRDADARQPARRRVSGCLVAGASGRHRAHLLPRRRSA